MKFVILYNIIYKKLYFLNIYPIFVDDFDISEYDALYWKNDDFQ